MSLDTAEGVSERLHGTSNAYDKLTNVISTRGRRVSATKVLWVFRAKTSKLLVGAMAKKSAGGADSHQDSGGLNGNLSTLF